MSWMPDEQSQVAEFIARLLRITPQIKLGPGVLRTIIPINIVGIPAVVAMGWALRSDPIFAAIVFIAGLAFLGWLSDRAFRYAEGHPIPALMSGTQILQLLQDQISAKDKSIIVDQPPVVAAPPDLLKAPTGHNGT